uniref:PDZ domain-containing protein n=1 Tax=Eutreptiella gymnastica TaxID=73025 RepID=A0A7S4LE76_9EUGL
MVTRLTASAWNDAQPYQGEDLDFTRPQWGPKVEALKKQVREIEEQERQLLDDFEKREVQEAGEMERLEVKYTEEMEQIREKDLTVKEELLRQQLRARKKQTKHVLEMKRMEVEQTMEQDLASQARDLQRQLTRKEEDLVAMFKKRETALAEELQRVKSQMMSDADSEEGVMTEVGLEVVNVSSRGGGCRVLRATGIARDAGLRSGDVITNVTTASDIRNKEDVGALLEIARPDEQMMLTLQRDSQQVQVVVTVGHR